MKLPIQILFAVAGAALLPACSCIPPVDSESLDAAGTIPVPSKEGGHATAEVSYSDTRTRQRVEESGGIHAKYNNTHTAPNYTTVGGATRKIVCKWGTGSLKPTVTWYRNGPIAGAVESTASGLTSGFHYVRFYNAGDGKWFPATPIKVDLSPAGRQATIFVKVTP